MTTTANSGAPVTAADTTDTVIQTVRLLCGHEFRYRIYRTLAESGFARIGVAWRCVTCDPTGDTKPRIAAVHNAPATDRAPGVYPCGAPLPRTRRVPTRDLRPGMQLLLPHVVDLGRPVRTVARVTENGMVNQHDEPLVNVHYAEPADENWGAANSGCWTSEWHVIEPDTPAR